MPAEFGNALPEEFNIVRPMNAPITAEIKLIIRLVILFLVNQIENATPTIKPITTVMIKSIKPLQ